MKKILHLIAALFAISISTNAQTQNAPGLGAAQEFAVLAGTSVVNTGSTLVYADLGTSPGSVILGFPPGIVLGEIRPGGVEPAAAQVDARKAYDFLGTLTPTSNMTGQQLGKGFARTPEAVAGTVLGPGVYRFDGNARLKGQLRLDGRGDPNSVFVIQVNGDFIVDEGSVISVQNGAQPRNIFFRVTGNVVVGDQGLAGTSSALKGNVLVQNNITLSNGTTHEGRLLSLGGNVVLNNNTIFLPLIVETDLAITKTADRSEVAVGDTITYTITVRNQGPDDATGVQVVETLPSSLAFIDFISFRDNVPANFAYNPSTSTFTIGNLAFGETATIKLRVRVLSSGNIVNNVRVIGNEPDPDKDDDEDEEPVVVPGVVTDLQTIKTVDKTRANVGDALTYTIVARNNGPNAATGVIIRDVLPTGQINITSQTSTNGTNLDINTGIWTIGNLASGQSVTLTINAVITASGTIVNTAIIRGNQADQQPDNNTSTVVTVVGPGTGTANTADLQVQKTVNKTRANVGDALVYTVTARNAGPNAATGVVVRDVLPLSQIDLVGNVTVSTGTYNTTTGIWTIGNLGVGQTATLTVNSTIKSNGTIVNTAVISGDQVDERPENNTSTVITVVGAGPEVPTVFTDLQVVKTVDKTRANIGDALVYNVTVRNNGPNNATSVFVVDVLPTNQLDIVGQPTVSVGTYNTTTGVWTIGALANGQTATLRVNATIKTSGTIVNTAIVRGNEADQQPVNNTSTVITIVGETPGPGNSTDLEVVKAVDKTRANVGDALRYDVTIKNNGPSNATGVLVVDVLPLGQLALVGQPTVSKGTYNVANGVWTVGNLASGESATLTVNSTITTAGTIVNTATIKGNEADPTPGNNSSTVITVVGSTDAGVANLAISKSVDRTEVTLGEQVVFTLRATNSGPSAATGVTVKDVLPAGFTFVSASPAAEYNATTGVWTIGNLAVGTTGRELRITATTTRVGRLRNVAVIDGDQIDPDDDDDEDDAEVCVRPTSPIVPNTTVCAGSNATFAITPIAGVVNFEVAGLPAGVTRVAGGGNTITLQVGANVPVGIYNISFVALNPNNTCSNSLPSTATLTVSATPGKPGQITASNSTLCSNVAIRYSVTPVTGATSYIWTVPAGWRLAGTTTGNGPFTTTAPEIELIPSTTAGQITVKAANACGTSEASVLAVTPGTTPAAPVIVNNSGPCTGLIYAIQSPVAGETYTWTAPAGFTFSNNSTTITGTTVTLTPTSNNARGTLSVVASNGGACGSAASTVEIDGSASDTQLFIPNVFTPNGDGVNDMWVIRNLEKYPDNDLAIYNRWGNEVFKTRGYNNTWQAQGLEEATYFYVLRVRGCNGEEQVYRGPVQVVR